MPTAEDVLLFIDNTGIYHAFQPWRTLSPEQREYLLKLSQALNQLTTLTSPNAPDPEQLEAAATLQTAMLVTLLPTVNPDELKQLHPSLKAEYLIQWHHHQPSIPFQPAPVA